ncbi:MAG: glutamate synthase-related protein, partial [Burkholderiaceae bacterium]
MFTPRYAGFYAAVAGFAACASAGMLGHLSLWWTAPFAGLLALGIHDVAQTRRSVLRNYPILGHFRFMFEAIRPELRQYIVESETEEIPFSRAQRSVVYQRAKNAMDSRAFGTELKVKEAGHEWINHSLAPSSIGNQDFRVTVGADRAKPYSISIFNISAMSFGALSANAIRALNSGAKKGGFAHDTGEGSISAYHREFGGDLIWEIGSGYFGCRNPDGSFNPELFASQALDPQVKMIEIKLSQGAKPGHGGVLPAAKITAEIAATRGIPMGRDCVSPAGHSEFDTPVG